MFFVSSNAGYKMQIANDILIETYNPTQYNTKLAMRVIKELLGNIVLPFRTITPLLTTTNRSTFPHSRNRVRLSGLHTRHTFGTLPRAHRSRLPLDRG